MIEEVFGVVRLRPEAVLPVLQHEWDAGWDVCAVDDVEIPPGAPASVRTGLVLVIPKGWEVQVRSRSGLALRGVSVLNSPGTVDAGYRGELAVILHNHTAHAVHLPAGSRVAQLVPKRVPMVSFREMSPGVLDQEETDRGDRGFGSTGF